MASTLDDTPAGRRLVSDLRSLLGDAGARLPPAIVETMDSSVERWEPGERIVMSFPARAEYAGPTGFVQGGVLLTAFDNAFGPVAFTATGELVVSLGLSGSFIRPLAADDARFRVEAVIDESTRRFAFVRGRAFDSQGRLVALATSQMIVMSGR